MALAVQHTNIKFWERLEKCPPKIYSMLQQFYDAISVGSIVGRYFYGTASSTTVVKLGRPRIAQTSIAVSKGNTCNGRVT